SGQSRCSARLPWHGFDPFAGMNMLDARGLDTFYGSSHILHGVDFSVAEGEAVALMGRNGMGKTTLIRSMLGLVRPRSGTVTFAGASLSALAPFRIARLGIAYIPERRGV